MHCVYILTSKKDKRKFYVGYTNNLQRRLVDHKNPPKNSYTHRYGPWALETYSVFSERRLAKAFEVYLKSHSGRAFLRRRLAVVS
ncbi:MAG: GIY-YIG nuclease family protein [Candidatus Omnitrophota bacterium]